MNLNRAELKQKFVTAIKNNLMFLVFVAAVLFVRGAFANQYLVPSGSMLPTIQIGDRVMVNRVAYDLKIPLTNIAVAHFGEPNRGDIVVFESPENGITLIKRLVAIPGDEVKIDNGMLWVNGQAMSHAEQKTDLGDGTYTYPEDIGRKHVTIRRITAMEHHEEMTFKVPPGNYFFMGDNRDNSADGRFFGFVPRRLLIGRANRVLFSLDLDKPLAKMVAWSRFGEALN